MDTFDIDFPLSRASIGTLGRTELRQKWQSRWNCETRGRPLHRLFPVVQTEIISGDFFLNQVLTEHGNSDAYKSRFFGENGVCRFCHVSMGTYHHYIFECPSFQEIRQSTIDLRPPLQVGHLRGRTLEIIKEISCRVSER